MRIILKKCRHNILGLFIMIMPGLVLDLIYRLNILDSLRQLLSSCGITYKNAFEILRSQAGMLMTMVSLFLTINIHIAERAEKKVFGISRKELFQEDHSTMYVWFRKMSCVSPVLFMIALNLHLCFTGYFLFLYCNVFLIIHFYKHRSSFGAERNRKAVVSLLKESLKGEEVTLDKVIQYRMILENIGSSAVKEGNWLELEEMYYSLLEPPYSYSDLTRYILSYYYYYVIFWSYNKNGFFSIQMLKRYMRRIDLQAAKENVISNHKWLALWGMLKAVCWRADEEELSIFLGWFLNFAERSRAVSKEVNQHIPISILNQQAGMLSILSEYRLRKRTINSSYLVCQMKQVWNYGKIAIQNSNFDNIEQLYSINEFSLEDDMAYIRDILNELKRDVRNHSKMSIITNL